MKSKTRFSRARKMSKMNIATFEFLEQRRLLSATLTAIAELSNPQGPVLRDSAGNFFTTETDGGAGGFGDVAEITAGGTYTEIAAFNGQNGSDPIGGVIADSAGDFYGTTSSGGANQDGTVFKVSQNDTITDLVSFNGANGDIPEAGLIADSSGNLYGTTEFGGLYDRGTIFEVTPNGAVTDLHSFLGGADGAFPYCTLFADSSGNLYGTDTQGGANSGGVVFKLAQNGTLAPLESFTSATGYAAMAGVVGDAAGNLYGTTSTGGPSGSGTVFKLTPGGTFTYSDVAPGEMPESTPLVDADGNIYGTTLQGGADGAGEIFEVTAGGSFATLASFNSFNGDVPYAGLIADSSGNLYGTADKGGPEGGGDGLLYELTGSGFVVGSPAPVSSELGFAQPPTSASVGSAISPPIKVAVESAEGTTITTDDSTVALSIASGPAGAVLGGTTTVAAVNGVATFSGLYIGTPGAYTLLASDGTLSTATSNPFTISAASTLVPTLGRVSLPSAVVAGAKLTAKVPVVVANTGSSLKGNVTVDLYADTGTTLDGNQVLVSFLTKKVSLKAGKDQSFVFSVRSLPQSLPDGTYHLIEEVIDPSGATNIAATTQTVDVAAAFVQPAVSVGSVIPATLALGKSGSISVTVSNTGNVSAGAIDLTLSPSSDGSTSIAGIVLASLRSSAKLAPGKSKTFRLRFKVSSALSAGSYYPYLTVSLGGVSTTDVGTAQFVIG